MIDLRTEYMDLRFIKWAETYFIEYFLNQKSLILVRHLKEQTVLELNLEISTISKPRS
jgi:hypothetical protein